MTIQAEESRADQKVKGFKQQLVDEVAREPVDDLVELEEILEETKGDEEVETPIRDCQERKKEEGRQRKRKGQRNKRKRRKRKKVEK